MSWIQRIIRGMKKLQVRLDHDETMLVIDALDQFASDERNRGRTPAAAIMAAHLEYRMARFWPPRDSTEPPVSEAAEDWKASFDERLKQMNGK